MSLLVKLRRVLAGAVYGECDLVSYMVAAVKQKWPYSGYRFCMGEFLLKAKVLYQGQLIRREISASGSIGFHVCKAKMILCT